MERKDTLKQELQNNFSTYHMPKLAYSTQFCNSTFGEDIAQRRFFKHLCELIVVQSTI